MTIARPAALSLLALPCVLFATACGEKSVSGDDVAAQVKTEIGKQATTKVSDVSCPDLEAKVGKSVKCTLTYADGGKQEITATVDKVDGDKASFKMVVTKNLS